MKYLIAGGAGFIGSNLVDKLISLGHQVIVLDNFCSGKIKNLAHHKNLKIYNQDICSDLNEIFSTEKPDMVFHLAALPRVQYSIQKPVEAHKTNVNGTLNLLVMSRKFSAERFIFASSCSVYGDMDILPFNEEMKLHPISPYALHKLIGEQYCRLFNDIYGLKTVGLRYFNVFGPRQDPAGGYACLIPKFIELINQNIQPTINGDGKQTRDFIYVNDVVDATIIAAKTENKDCFGEIFNIGTGINISVNEIAQKILEITGKNIKPIHGPPVIEPKNAQADIAKTRDILGWQPRISFEEGLRGLLPNIISTAIPRFRL